jgi:hypothetical protein
MNFRAVRESAFRQQPCPPHGVIAAGLVAIVLCVLCAASAPGIHHHQPRLTRWLHAVLQTRFARCLYLALPEVARRLETARADTERRRGSEKEAGGGGPPAAEGGPAEQQATAADGSAVAVGAKATAGAELGAVAAAAAAGAGARKRAASNGCTDDEPAKRAKVQPGASSVAGGACC